MADLPPGYDPGIWTVTTDGQMRAYGILALRHNSMFAGGRSAAATEAEARKRCAEALRDRRAGEIAAMKASEEAFKRRLEADRLIQQKKATDALARLAPHIEAAHRIWPDLLRLPRAFRGINPRHVAALAMQHAEMPTRDMATVLGVSTTRVRQVVQHAARLHDRAVLQLRARFTGAAPRGVIPGTANDYGSQTWTPADQYWEFTQR